MIIDPSHGWATKLRHGTVALDPYVSRLSGGYYGLAAEIPYYLRGKLLDSMGSNILSLIPFVSGDLHISNFETVRKDRGTCMVWSEQDIGLFCKRDPCFQHRSLL